jgi:hypothetical protein
VWEEVCISYGTSLESEVQFLSHSQQDNNINLLSLLRVKYMG